MSRATSIFHALPNLLYSLWLFTYSDLKTIVIPSTTFGLIQSIVWPQINRTSVSTAFLHTFGHAMLKLPPTLLWVWINLLPFTIDNQRQAVSIEEDRINKPWRTMPSRRLTPEQAKRLMFVLYVVAFCVSFALGAPRQSMALMALGFFYNDCEGADRGWAVRNLINAFGFMSFASGASEVAVESEQQDINYWEGGTLEWWLGVVGLVVATTVQTQDMYDQEGDAARGRKTLPLVWGDSMARWCTAIAMAFWSIVCPWFWQVSSRGSVASVMLGLLVVGRTLCSRSVAADKVTFRFWNLWMMSLYVLPVMKFTGREKLIHDGGKAY